MVKAVITKGLKKRNNDTENSSIGLKRFFHLPSRVRNNIELSLYLKNEHITNKKEIISFFENLKEDEYINYLTIQ